MTSVPSLPCRCWTSLKKDSIPTFLFYVSGGLPRCYVYVCASHIHSAYWGQNGCQMPLELESWTVNSHRMGAESGTQVFVTLSRLSSPSHHLSLPPLSFVSGWTLQDFLRRPPVISSSSPCSSASSTSLSALGTRQWSSGRCKHVLHGWASNLWDGKPGLAFEAATEVVLASTNWSSRGPLDF